jgi:hypothetical protein
MAEFAVVESDNAEVGLKFASAAMPERDIVEFSPFMNGERSISIEMKAHLDHACSKGMQPVSIEVFVKKCR